MLFAKASAVVWLFCACAISGCAHTSKNENDAAGFEAQRDKTVAALTAQATPGNLATAALLAQLGDRTAGQSLDLIERAETLAPNQPELVWLHRAICERLSCGAKVQIEAKLEALDPGNGFVWMPDLERAQALGSDNAVADAILRIGAGPRMTLYWNEVVVMMVDALAVADPSQSLAVRGVQAFGMAAALVIPPLQPLSKACRFEHLDQTGRRAACEAMVACMEQSSTVITQMLALGIEERWWPAGSAQRAVVDAKRRRVDYLLAMSSRVRWWRMKRDVALRIDAVRRTAREEDVELAILKSYGVPPEPPIGWKDTLRPRS
jgi:hypothetical protein